MTRQDKADKTARQDKQGAYFGWTRFPRKQLFANIHRNRWLHFCIFPCILQNRLWRSRNEYYAEQNILQSWPACNIGVLVSLASFTNALQRTFCQELPDFEDTSYAARLKNMISSAFCPRGRRPTRTKKNPSIRLKIILCQRPSQVLSRA